MKKQIVLALLVALSLNGITAQASDMGYAAALAIEYYSWGRVFGVSDISMDYEYADKNEAGNGTLYLDDIAVVYDWQTLETDSVYLFFDESKDDVSHQIMRVNALVAALEYDEQPQPEEWTFTKAGNMLVKTMPVFKDLCDAVNNSAADILSGKSVPFHVGQDWTYYISKDSAMGYIVFAQ